ncbi:unnamed protein product, partial [Rotaria sp. Silwood1]
MYLEWTTTGRMYYAREWHTASVLTSGKVLVAGGLDVGGVIRLNSAELYDPSTRMWKTTGHMKYGREWHVESILINGKVLAIGGMDDKGRLKSAE